MTRPTNQQVPTRDREEEGGEPSASISAGAGGPGLMFPGDARPASPSAELAIGPSVRTAKPKEQQGHSKDTQPPPPLATCPHAEQGPAEDQRCPARQPHICEVPSPRGSLCPVEINHWSFRSRNCKSATLSPEGEAVSSQACVSHRWRLSPGASQCTIVPPPHEGPGRPPLQHTAWWLLGDPHTELLARGGRAGGQTTRRQRRASWKPRVSAEVRCVSKAWPSASEQGAFVCTER